MNGVNTANGNRLTAIPLVSWVQRGGLPVAFALYHNSRSASNSTLLGYKWSHSYQSSLSVDENGNATVTWGDGRSYPIDKSGSNYLFPKGINETLTTVGAPITTYKLLTHEQVEFDFTRPNGTAWVCTAIKDLNGNTITVSYNGSDQVTSVTDCSSGGGRSLTFAYSGGHLTTVTDPVSRAWTLNYTSDDLTRIDYPAVTVDGGSQYYDESFGYSGHDITTFTDKRGSDWTFTYDGNHRCTGIEDPAGNAASFDYDAPNYLTTNTDPNGNENIHYYDTNWTLTAEADALGYNTTFVFYSDNYDMTDFWDFAGNYTASTFDSNGNRLTSTDPNDNATTYTYNGYNQVTSVVDPLNLKTEWTYDAVGNVTHVKRYDGSNPRVLKSTVAYGYPTPNYGLPAMMTDDNSNVTKYFYDSNERGLLVEMRTPDKQYWYWGYDALGVCNSQTDAKGDTVNLNLDEWRRLVKRDYYSGTDTTYEYDANNNLVEMVDATGTTTFTYDVANRKTEEANSHGSIGYTYDATGKLGLLSTMTDWDGDTVTYAYTTRNELYTVTDSAGTATYAYGANPGSVTSVTLPNGSKTITNFDDGMRVSAVAFKKSDNSVIDGIEYTYSDGDQITATAEENGDSESFGYNALGQLTAASRSGGHFSAYSETYTLDANGNRTQRVRGDTTYDYLFSPDDCLISEKVGESMTRFFAYDGSGSQISRTFGGVVYTLEYDYERQLVAIKQNGTPITAFTYDGLGRRVSRTHDGTTTYFLYDGKEIVNEEVEGDITATYRFGQSLIRQWNGSDNLYPMFDARGNLRLVLDEDEEVVAECAPEGTGSDLPVIGATAMGNRYGGAHGYRDDGDVGLIHVGARYYDPSNCRFITRDSYLDQYPYVYCYGDPINNIDPSGHVPWDTVRRFIPQSSGYPGLFGGGPTDFWDNLGSQVDEDGDPFVITDMGGVHWSTRKALWGDGRMDVRSVRRPKLVYLGQGIRTLDDGHKWRGPWSSFVSDVVEGRR